MEEFDLITISSANDSLKRYTIIVMSLIRTSDIVSRYLELEMRKSSSSAIGNPIQFAVVNALCQRSGRKTPTAISKWMFRATHTITSMLDTLERKQLVQREADRKDRRSVNIIVTDAGKENDRKMIPIVEEISQEALSCLEDEQIEALNDILRQIRKHLLKQIDNASARDKQNASFRKKP